MIAGTEARVNDDRAVDACRSFMNMEAIDCYAARKSHIAEKSDRATRNYAVGTTGDRNSDLE